MSEGVITACIVAVGLSAGFLAGRLTQPTESPDTLMRVHSPSRPVQASTPLTAPPTPPAGSETTRRLAWEQSRHVPGSEAAEALGALVGDPIPWPDDTERSHSEADLRAVSETLAEREGVSLVSVDCTAYPCMAFFEGAPSSVQPWRAGHRVLLIELPSGDRVFTAAIDIPPDLSLTDEAAMARAWDRLLALDGQ